MIELLLTLSFIGFIIWFLFKPIDEMNKNQEVNPGEKSEAKAKAKAASPKVCSAKNKVKFIERCFVDDSGRQITLPVGFDDQRILPDPAPEPYSESPPEKKPKLSKKKKAKKIFKKIRDFCCCHVEVY